ncbi:hypothetical protein O0L34_g18342 [Tuta absoluta]|nr:hypothetical protein O0L34_g18342 [Tuta absoluta]
MEPVHPTFKEDYRRIVLDDRTWLHVEVTPDGLATNIHLIGQSEYWQNKLQEGLLKWDHDMDIVRNIMNIFDITEFPRTSSKSRVGPIFEDMPAEKPVCSICLCDELPEISGVPLPLCQNPTCGIFFHRNCLFQWLVACSGGRPPAFGVANGSCPTCLQPITCNENDS